MPCLRMAPYMMSYTAYAARHLRRRHTLRFFAIYMLIDYYATPLFAITHSHTPIYATRATRLYAIRHADDAIVIFCLLPLFRHAYFACMRR